MLLKISAKKLMPYLLTFLMVALVFVNIPFTTHAAFSGGSGTENDPYLIKTADDLYNMRNNLSANYKLAATIDMSGYKTSSKFFKNGFVPIGDDSTKPFTGSFTCDLGSDGLPLYAIFNLKIYNAKGDLYNHDWYGESDYPDALGQKAPYFYQTGLFGNTKGASISNIYLIDADIYSSVVGQHRGRYANLSDASSLISYAAFIDEMGTGALVGAAVDTDIYHCAATGKIDGKTNMHGGLVGRASGGSISASYVDAEVATGGVWQVGGFIGYLYNGGVIKECASFGSLDASMDGYGKLSSILDQITGIAGGFIGRNSGSVQDCYTTVIISKKSNAYSFVGDSEGSARNCYVNAEIKGNKKAEGGSNSNCFISSDKAGVQLEFAVSSLKNISKYFSSQSAWNISSGTPLLKSVTIVKDTSVFTSSRQSTATDKVTSSTTAQSSSVQSASSSQSSSSSADSVSQDGVSEQSGSIEQNDVGETTSEEVATGETESAVQDPAVEDYESSEGNDIIQLVIVGVLSVLTVSISIFSVVVAINALNFNKKTKADLLGAEDEEEE